MGRNPQRREPVSLSPLPVDARSTDRAREVFVPLPRRYDRLADVLSFGQNARWRRAMVTAATADDPARVLDVATGTAGVALQLAERSRAEVVGVDISEEMLATGRQRVADAGQDDRVSLQVADADALPFDDASFDALTFTYLLRYVPDPAATLRELARVVEPGGRIASLEFHVPPNPVWCAAWVGYTRLLLPALGGLLGGRGWWRVGAFLGPNIDRHYARFPLDRHVDLWHEAGIVDVEVELMSLGGGVVMSGRRGG